jgi:hypothetical protein
MLEETSLEKKKAEAKNLLEKLKLAVNQPRLFVYQFFEDIRNDIDTQSCIALNDSNKERIYKHQAELISTVQEFESLCLEQVNVDSVSDFQVSIEQTESILNKRIVSNAELDRVKGLLSNELRTIEKALFHDKCMFFVKAGDNSATDNLVMLSNIIEQNNLFGLLIIVEDCFVQREAFNKK